jgi:site-specific DNA recombinase
MDGKQPLGFTSDWCLRHDFPSEWTAQRDLIATLLSSRSTRRIAKMAI